MISTNLHMLNKINDGHIKHANLHKLKSVQKKENSDYDFAIYAARVDSELVDV